MRSSLLTLLLLPCAALAFVPPGVPSSSSSKTLPAKVR